MRALGLVSAGVGLGALALGASDAAAEEKQPNIILINADDLGWMETGAYGQKHIKTPNIDQMAREGIRFTQFYAGAAVCAPSRCNLMTGKHAGRAYVRDNFEQKDRRHKTNGFTIFGGQAPLPTSEVTVAEILKQRGYTTGCFGKWGLGGQGTSGDPLKQGFDTYYGYNCQRNAHNLYPNYLEDNGKIDVLEGNTRGLTGKKFGPQEIATRMLKFIRKNKEKPFFLYYPTVLPHLPLQVPEEDLNAYKGKFKETPYRAGGYLSHPTPRACYAAMISFIDKQVGNIYATLKELGLDDNTIVIFTSDNGTTYLKRQVDYDFFDSVGPLRGLKGSLYEGGIRVPLIVRWPGKIKAGSVSNLPAAQYDILPTLSELTNGHTPDEVDGISFLNELLGREQAEHAYLFWDFKGYGGQTAVRMGDWKAIRRNVGRNPNAPLELYNLREDVGEKNNVAKQHPELIVQMETLMFEARERPKLSRFQFGKYKN